MKVSLDKTQSPQNSMLQDLAHPVIEVRISSLKERPISQELIHYANLVQKWYESKKDRMVKMNNSSFQPKKRIIGFEVKNKYLESKR